MAICTRRKRATRTGSGGSAIGCMGGPTIDDTYENPRSHVNHKHPADGTGVEVTKLRTIMKTVVKQVGQTRSLYRLSLKQVMKSVPASGRSVPILESLRTGDIYV